MLCSPSSNHPGGHTSRRRASCKREEKSLIDVAERRTKIRCWGVNSRVTRVLLKAQAEGGRGEGAQIRLFRLLQRLEREAEHQAKLHVHVNV